MRIPFARLHKATGILGSKGMNIEKMCVSTLMYKYKFVQSLCYENEWHECIV